LFISINSRLFIIIALFDPFITRISKSSESNSCLTLKWNSDFRDSEVRDSFISLS